MWHDGWMSGWGWFWMTIAMVAFWGLAAWVVVSLVRGSDRPDRAAGTILDERFASGELDEDEYRRRKTALQH